MRMGLPEMEALWTGLLAKAQLGKLNADEQAFFDKWTKALVLPFALRSGRHALPSAKFIGEPRWFYDRLTGLSVDLLVFIALTT